MPQIPPLLADVEALIKIAIGFIVFIGWISKLVSQQQQKGAGNVRPVRPAAPRNKQIRDELEAFIREAQGEKPRPPAPNQPQVELLSADDVELVDAPRKPKPTSGSRSKPSRPAANRTPQAKSRTKPSQSDSARRPPGQAAAERQPEAAPLGTSLQQHVQSHMGERVAAQASRDVEPTVDDSVAAHFGSFSADAPSAQAVPSAANSLLGMLRSPQHARQAFILSEILKPPVRSRRR